MLRIINLALAIFASALDIRVAVYFSTTIKECDLSEGIPCFCDSSKKGFDDTFRQWGSYSCDNVFTRNPDNLVANAVFTLACALLLFSYLVTFLLSLPSGPPCAP